MISLLLTQSDRLDGTETPPTLPRSHQTPSRSGKAVTVSRLCRGLCLMILVLLISSPSQAFRLPIDLDNTSVQIVAQVDYLESSRLGITAQQVVTTDQNLFTPQQRQLITTGFEPTQLWLRVKLINFEGKKLPVVMVFDTRSAAKIEHYNDSGVLLHTIGEQLPFDWTDNPNFLLGVPYTLDPGSSVHYFKIDAHEPIQMALSLKSQKNYRNQSYKKLIMDLLQILPILVISLVVLILSISERRGSSLLIAGIAFSIAIYEMAQAGLFAPMIYLPYIDLTIRNMASMFTSLFLIMLSNEVTSHKSMLAKILGHIVVATIIGALLFVISSAAIPYSGLLWAATVGLNTALSIGIMLTGKPGTQWIGIGMAGLAVHNMITLLGLFGYLDNHEVPNFIAQLMQNFGLVSLTIFAMSHVGRQRSGHVQDSLTNVLQKILTKIQKDIKLPAGGIVEMSRLLSDANLSIKQQEYLNTIRLSGIELVQKSREIDALNRLYGSQGIGDPEPVMLHDFLQNIVAETYQDAALKGIELVLDISPNVHQKVLVHREILEMVLASLLRNAIAYTFSGDIVFNVTTDNTTDIRFRITDSGSGIPPDQRKTLFHFQDDTVSQSSITLPLCSHLVDKLGGQLGVSSKMDVGTSFWFSLKLPREYMTSVQVNPKMLSLAGLKILITDENKNNRRVVSHLAENMGISVDSCSTGSEAMALLQTKAQLDQHYDFILIDHNMSHMTSAQVAHRIKESDTLRSGLKVILMHAQTISPNQMDPALGVDGWLQKPISSHNLYNALITFLPQHEDN